VVSLLVRSIVYTQQAQHVPRTPPDDVTVTSVAASWRDLSAATSRDVILPATVLIATFKAVVTYEMKLFFKQFQCFISHVTTAALFGPILRPFGGGRSKFTGKRAT